MTPDDLERQKLEALADFAAGAGHEMNNPLAVISGRAQLLLRDEQDVERRHALALVRTQAMRVHEMIADLMLFARPPAIKPEAVDLRALLDRILAELAEEHDLGGDSLRRSGPVVTFIRHYADNLRLTADPTQLAVAIKAIVRNAIEAQPDGGRVEISVTQTKKATAIKVTDNGPGISAAEREHLFNPFYAGRQAGRGLGLGLSKAWRIVTQHGGRIDVSAAPDGGAAFTLLLPKQSP